MNKEGDSYYDIKTEKIKEQTLEFFEPANTKEQLSKDCKEEDNANTTTKKQQEKIKEGEEQKKEQMVAVDPSLFSQAAQERKNMNLSQLKVYMGKRIASYQQRSKIFQLLRNKLYEKQKLSKKIIQTITKYFNQYENLLRFLHKSISNKLELKKKYKNFNMLASITESIDELVELNNKECEHLEKFIDWIQKILIQAFKAAHTFYKDRIKKFSKNLQKFDYTYYDAFDKEQKCYEKITEGNDLLERELELMEKIKITDQAVIGRGVQIHQAWEAFLEEQKTLKKLLRENILQFNEQYIKFHKKIEAANNLYKFWDSLKYTPKFPTVFQSLLDQNQISFICYEDLSQKLKQEQKLLEKNPNQQPKSAQISAQDKQKKVRNQVTKLQKNLQNFLRLKLEEKRTGNPYPSLQILIVKKFKSKVQRGSREWNDIKLIFSVDKNLILYDEFNGKCLLKLAQSTVRLKRVSQNILQLIGTQIGFLINSTRREMIHFQTLDEVEEFIYFVEKIPKTK